MSQPEKKQPTELHEPKMCSAAKTEQTRIKCACVAINHHEHVNRALACVACCVSYMQK